MLFVIYFCALLSTGISVSIEKRRIKFPPEEVVLIRTAFLECGKENGITPNTIQLIKDGYYSEDDAFKKYIFCVYQETGYGKPDGHVNISKAVTLYPKDVNMVPVYENCDLQGADPMETAFLSFKCYQETTPVLLA